MRVAVIVAGAFIVAHSAGAESIERRAPADPRGELMIGNVAGDVRVLGGEVSVHGHGGKGLARVTTVSGDVRLQDIGPELELNKVSGDMQVRAAELSRCRIKTTNGDLELRAALARDARVDAEGINGDLRFRLRGKMDAQFDIETFNGEIDNCFGPKPRRTHEFGPGTELRFKEGNGNGRVRIKALNGGVEICNR